MSAKVPENVNFYEILDLTLEASSSDIRSAYKKKALKCHPDKNPDNPKAAELFHQLTKALEVLLDESARCAYDKLLKAKEAAKLRHKALDEKRKRFKEDLEARERAAAPNALKVEKYSEEERFRREVERLREEGAKLVQDEIKLLQEQVLQEVKVVEFDRDVALCQLKVTWEDGPDADSGYTQESLRRIFLKYGDIVAVAASERKAIIEFKESKAADLAMKIEVGFTKNPLKITYASSKIRKAKNRQPQYLSETLTERAARQEAERSRLIEELRRQDANNY